MKRYKKEREHLVNGVRYVDVTQLILELKGIIALPSETIRRYAREGVIHSMQIDNKYWFDVEQIIKQLSTYNDETILESIS